jgi:AraC family transcriptional regulator, ethanolamine operon transcriptional activator
MKFKIAGATKSSLSVLRKFSAPAGAWGTFLSLDSFVAPPTSDPVSEYRAWISDVRFYDIDAQAAQYHGYDQEYHQLSRGPFEGRCRSFTFGDELVINFEMANREIAASASTPRGRYGACFLADTSPPCALNATEFSHRHIVLTPERASVEGRMSEGLRIYCMDVSDSLLPDGGHNMRATGVLEQPTGTGRLRELVQAGIATFSALQTPSDYPAAVCGFKSSVADLLWQMAALPRESAVESRRYSSARALRVFRRAREYIDHHLADGISIVTLCRDTGVSRRSLESVFRSVVGVGPGSYVRALQLNRVRRDLLSELHGDVSIGVIAARHGIWHWSRLSSYYRRMFGELPSETRSRRAFA